MGICVVDDSWIVIGVSVEVDDWAVRECVCGVCVTTGCRVVGSWVSVCCWVGDSSDVVDREVVVRRGKVVGRRDNDSCIDGLVVVGISFVIGGWLAAGVIIIVGVFVVGSWVLDGVSVTAGSFVVVDELAPCDAIVVGSFVVSNDSIVDVGLDAVGVLAAGDGSVADGRGRSVTGSKDVDTSLELRGSLIYKNSLIKLIIVRFAWASTTERARSLILQGPVVE